MNLDFLCIGDLHCKNYKQFSHITKYGINSRLLNCFKVLRLLRHKALELGIDKVLLNGDTLDSADFIETEVYSGLYDEIEKFYAKDINVVINVGNHEVLSESESPESDRRIIHCLRPFKRVATVVEEPQLVWKALQVVPWMSNKKKLAKAISRLDASKEYGLAVHCGVSGALIGLAPYFSKNLCTLKDLRHAEFGFVVLSDYHDSQELADNTFYTGSPLQHTAGEVHVPGIWRVSLHNGGFQKQKILTNLPIFRTIKVFSKADLRDADNVSGNYCRFILETEDPELESVIELMSKKQGFQYKLIFKDKGEEEFEDVERLPVEEVIAKYVKRNATKEQRERLTILGRELFIG